MRLNTLGGATLEGTGFRRPKALLLLAYLAVEGPRERRHLRTLFWPEGTNPALSLRGLLFELRTVSPNLVKTDRTRIGLGIPADVTELLAAFNDAPDSVPKRYTGAFLEGLSGAELGAELEEWVLLTREFLARQVRANLLLRAESVPVTGAMAAAVLVQQAWSLPGAPPVEVDELQRMYRLCAAVGHGLSATLLQEAKELGVDLPLPLDPLKIAFAQPPNQAKINLSPLSGLTTFIGRETELADLQALLIDPEIRLLTVLGPGGIGKTRLALEIARTYQASQVVYVPLDAVIHPQEVPGRIANALGVDFSEGQVPMEALVSRFASQPLLLVLDNFEHLLPADQTLASLLVGCTALSILVTSREPLHLSWESVYPLSGLDLAESDGGAAVQLFFQRARKADGRFRLTPDVWPDVVDICRQVGGSPLGIELAAAWVRTLSVTQISAELRCDVQLLERQADKPTDQHRNLRLIFESAWSRLSEDQQRLLSGLAVFHDGFSREAAATILGATLPQLLGFLDASLLRMTGSGRYDLHPLMSSYVQLKSREDSVRREHLNKAHAKYFASQADEASQAFDHGKNQSHWATWGNVEYGNLQAALGWSQQRGQWTLALKLCRYQRDEWVKRGQVRDGINRLLELLTAANELMETSEYRWGLLTVCDLRQCLKAVAWDETDDQRMESTVNLMRQANDHVGTFWALNLEAISIAENRGLEESRAIFQAALSEAQLGNFPRGQASALSNLASLATSRLDLLEAHARLTQVISIAASNGLKYNQAMALLFLGKNDLHAGAYNQARAHLAQAKTLFTGLGESPRHMKSVTQLQGEVFFLRSTLTQATENGDLNAARHWFQESETLAALDSAGLNNSSGASSLGEADVLLMLGNLVEANALFEQDLSKAEQLGYNILVKGSLLGLGQVAYELGHFEHAWTYFRRVLAEQVDPYNSIYGIEGLAATAGRLGDGPGAASLWSAAAHIRQSMGLPLHPIYRERHEKRIEETKSTMNEVDFESAWVKGSQLTLAAAIELAFMYDLSLEYVLERSSVRSAVTAKSALTVHDGK